MRYILLYIFLFFYLPLFSQEQQVSVCYILYVRGEIKKQTGQKLATGDIVSFNDIGTLKFETPGAMINLFESTIGSFRMTEKEIIAPKGHENFFNFLTHLLKVKGHQVSLSSRGDCTCIEPRSCFSPDTSINDKVLLVDVLSFNADEIINKAEKAFYFLQYKSQKRKLRVVDGSVQITPADFVFRDTSFAEGETPELTIGLYVKDGPVDHLDLVANLRFNIVSLEVLQNYYKSLALATGEQNLMKLKEAFINDVYLYFGKPSLCQVENIIKSVKE